MEEKVLQLIEKLEQTQNLTKQEWTEVIGTRTEKVRNSLFDKATKAAWKNYGHDIYIRGLIEISSYCKNDCYYCGIRSGNKNAQRYRLSKEQILECSDIGYDLGYRTYVLQGGEDPYFSPERMADIIFSIKERHPDTAITISMGEAKKETYQMWFDAGADRYLLRHETADFEHYGQLHPVQMSAKHRQDCLYILKEIGYQVGTGFMVGTPGQTPELLAEDMLFIKKLHPHMVGIGPFVPHHDTPFKDKTGGSVELTTFMLGLLRLMSPSLLLPATTALGTIDPLGREKGIQSGANVVMPNLSPVSVRKKYELYDNKICTGDEAAECRGCLSRRMDAIGYHIVESRGDHRSLQ